MPYKYVRIQGKEISKTTGSPVGVFSLCWKLIQKDIMEKEDADLFRKIDSWINEILPVPEACSRKEKVICYFKTENIDEMLERVKPALKLLSKYNHPYYVVYTNTPGEIVYEDKYQVAVKAEDIFSFIEPEDYYEDQTKKTDRSN